MIIGLVALFAISLLSLFFNGNHVYSIKDVFNAIFHYNSDVDNQVIIRESNIPRVIADMIVGASLAIAGAIMQGTTKNPMADSGIMGISAGSTLGVIIVVAFMPWAGRYEKMALAATGAAVVTILIYLIAFVGKGKITADRMVLSGMAVSTLLTSLTTAIIIKEGLMTQMVRYTNGSSANTIWKDIYSALPIFIIGPVAYIGLMIPYICRYLVGTDYRLVLPSCGILGATFVLLVDLVAKTIHPGFEFPIGLIITIIGVPFFIYVSRRQEGDSFYD